MKVLNKITLKDLNNFKAGQLKAQCAEAEAPVLVGRIVGSVRSQSVKASPYGDALCFKGTFVGYGQDGEQSRATACYLPSPIDQMLSDQINELQGDKERLESPVDFALDVFAVPDKGETGYKYVCKPLIETAVADPIAALLGQIKPLSLAAPIAEVAETSPEVAEAAPTKAAKK
ncbi:MAG TPA: hypothetical protein VJM50_21090 [Pyrinomonadaceae bacterium]|nr:hypothetical protein [Pyrinomonadaceae bacterium]